MIRWCARAILVYLTLRLALGLTPAAGDEPVIRLEADGPTSLVTALAFAPDASTLYTAGWDKIVRVWTRSGPTERFVLDAAATMRVPIGPGQSGAINAMALSPDGNWLAVAGNAPVRREAGFRQSGFILPRAAAMTDEMRHDQGRIFVFHTSTRELRVLEGHRGSVVALAFAPSAPNGTAPWLVSAAYETLQGTESRIVRAWDLARPGPQAAYELLPKDSTKSRPGLAAWRSGASPKQLNVAVAWGDSSLRVWDVERQTQQVVADGRFNNSVAHLPNSNRLVTGSDVKLQFWSIGQAGQPPIRQNSIALDGVPRTIAAFSSGGDGSIDRAAIVYRTASPAEIDHVQFVDLDRGRVTAAGIQLWSGAGTTPALAVAARGAVVAVAGGQENVVAVIAPKQATAAPNVQLLRSSGKVWQSVRFVKRDDRLGIRIGSKRAARDQTDEVPVASGDMIFDFARHKLIEVTPDWQSAEPQPADWAVQSIPGTASGDRPASTALSVRLKGKELSRIVVDSGTVVDGVAILPPVGSGDAIVAVASYNLGTGEPRLVLFNGASGEPFRQFTGHTARIYSLSFSADGRLLASVSADQTLSVWSLTDVDKVLGKRGAVPDLVVSQQGNDITVVQVPNSEGSLRVGDSVTGIGAGATVEKITSALQFYEMIGRIKPGDAVRIRARSRDGKDRDAAIRVRQGIDERKPLFSIFTSIDPMSGQPVWVGWSPMGPYEASDRPVEKLLGWHFNPKAANEAVSFARIEQYRDEYYRDGLLGQLVDQGQIPTSSKVDPLPRPELRLWVQEADSAPVPIAEQATVRVRARDAEMHLAIYDSFPVDRLDQISWKLPEPIADLPDQGRFTRVTDREWQADLEKLLARRRIVPLTVSVRTNEQVPQVFERQVVLRYQPGAPEIQVDVPQRVVRAPTAILRATVRPSLGGEKFSVRVSQMGAELDSSEQGSTLEIRRDVQLVPGDNNFEIVAQNTAALATFESDETTREVISISYFPPTQPEIRIESITPVPERSADDTGRVGSAAELVVQVPRVRVRGRMRVSDEPLTVAALSIANARHDVAGFESGKQKELVIDQEVPLKPGANDLNFLAKSANSDMAQSTHTVTYRPELPRAAISSPESGHSIYGQSGLTPVEVEGRLILPDVRQPYQASLLVNGQELDPPAPLRLDESAGTFRGEIGAKPGLNRIQLKLTNEWGSEWISDATQLHYLRPPQVIGVEPPKVGRTPLVDLVARVRSPADLPLVRVQVGERVLPANAVVAESTTAGITEWVITARGTPLERGDNTLSVLAWNQDGRCMQPGKTRVRFDPPPPPKARVDILDPSSNVVVESSRYSVRFRVSSQSSLTRVDVEHEGRVVHTSDASGVAANPQGEFVLEDSVPLRLDRKNNAIRVVAVNDGGEQAAAVAISYVPPPVRVIIDQMTPKNRPDAALLLDLKNGVMVDAAPDAQMTVHGRVVWPDQFDTRLVEAKWLHLRVNGMQQLPAALEPAEGDSVERRFTATLWLQRANGNAIELELPGLAHEAGSRLAFQMNCRNPQRLPKVHLLVIGVGESDREELRSRALRAVQVQSSRGDSFTTPAFSSGQLYTLAGPWVSHGQIVGKFEVIRRSILNSKSTGDVVIIYYQGRESIDSNGRFLFHASDRSIASDYIEGMFANVPGAQVWLLDVTRERVQELSRLIWPAHIGVLQFAWQNTGDSPIEARLIASLADAANRASRLADIEAHVSERYRELRQTYSDGLQYEPHLPPALADLNIGAGTDSGSP